MASHFDLVTLVMSLAGGALVRTAQMASQPGDYQQQGIMAITETRWFLLLSADEKSIDGKIWTSVLTQSG